VRRIQADAAIVGAGPAGLAALRELTRAGLKTVVLDMQTAPGGNIWRGRRLPAWAAQAWGDPMAERLMSATVIDAEPGFLAAERNGRAIEVTAPRIILATGARDLMLPMPGWSLPGVFAAGGLQAMMKGGMSVRGRRILVAGSGPLLMAVASEAVRRGADVTLAEQAPFSAWIRWGQEAGGDDWSETMQLSASLAECDRRTETWPTAIRPLGSKLTVSLEGRHASEDEFDCIGLGWGLTPQTELAQLMGCEVGPHGITADRSGQTSVPGVWAAGEGLGIAGAEAARQDGEAAGLAAAGKARKWTKESAHNVAWSRRKLLASLFALDPDRLPQPDVDTLACLCEGVTWSEVEQAESAVEAKLCSRIGMGLCQGRICGAALQARKGWTPGPPQAPLFPAPASVIDAIWQNDRHA
jgi:NADPH-dependent 2,4-dienoyl-CoA reductase/sulfur reductase-like enzyme